jgi:hypothetical protein
MSSRDDLKKMLKQYSIPLKGLKNKQDYVQAAVHTSIDLEDRAFSSLPASDSDFHNLIPEGWMVSEDGALPRLADRVLVYCWDNWSCGVVTNVFNRDMRRPVCELSSSRATCCVHWPSERTKDGDVRLSYFHLSKNNHYEKDRELCEPSWIILCEVGVPSNDE